jgi:maltooligosyltrehalose trehalohydrolase
MNHQPDRLGATYLGEGCCAFRVWAPYASQVGVRLVAPLARRVPLVAGAEGYHGGVVEGVEPGARYFYVLDGQKERPDPASRHQPEGVHGPSAVVDPAAFTWTDAGWFGLSRRQLVTYELHVGTFTDEGTFEAVVPHLDTLTELGITAVELMPVAQFPGSRNWGYDGVYPYAVQASYGGPAGLRRLVDACHARGLALFLDVVYNHLGPEGNYLRDFGPYFTDVYHTPWGAALNFDGASSGAVRHYFVENARYWLRDYHVDGFRLDAVHAILDRSAVPFLEELGEVVHNEGERLGRRVHVIAESDLNDARLIRPRVVGGYGLDAQWSDDFHHSLHALLTGERDGYYQDFGRLEDLACALRDGYAYADRYSAFRQRRHGNAPWACTADQFVICAQNHDQVGNRAAGERLTALTDFAGLKLAAAAVCLAPFLPLLFMGEEYGEPHPFQYFVSHSDAALVEAVRRGRRAEFAAFHDATAVPDPQDEATFRASRLQHALRGGGQQRALSDLYRELLRLRREQPALAELSRQRLEVVAEEPDGLLLLRRWTETDEVGVLLYFGSDVSTVAVPLPAGRWATRLDTADPRWQGDGSAVPAVLDSPGRVDLNLRPRSAIVFVRERGR